MKLFDMFNKKNKYDFLNEIDGVTLYAGLSNKEIDDLVKECKEKLNFKVTEDIKLFFSATNGFYFKNGTTFYPKYSKEIKNREFDDIVEHNVEYRDFTDIDEFFILGEDSLSFFVYNFSNKKYCVLSNGILNVMNEYESLDVMIEEILTGKVY